MNFQLSTAHTGLENVLRDISDVPQNTFIQWCNWIGVEAYHFLLGCEPQRFLSSQTYVAQTGTQALPAGFDTVKYDGCGFWEVDAQGNQTDNRLAITNFGSNVKGYYLSGENVVFTGITQPITVTLKYSSDFTLFTSMSDYFTVGGLSTGAEIIPLDHLEIVVNGLVYFYRQWNEDTVMEGVALAKYHDSLEDLAGHFRRIPDAYTMPDNSNSY